MSLFLSLNLVAYLKSEDEYHPLEEKTEGGMHLEDIVSNTREEVAKKDYFPTVMNTGKICFVKMLHLREETEKAVKRMGGKKRSFTGSLVTRLPPKTCLDQKKTIPWISCQC